MSAAATTTPHGAALDPHCAEETRIFRLNTPPAGNDPAAELPAGFLEFLLPLHRRFSPWQETLLAKRNTVLEAAHHGQLPTHLPAGEAQRENWKIDLPEWVLDQRNQMTGPGDDAELVVKMLNSGAPGVMLDLEDSTVNKWSHQRLAVRNIISALEGTLTYEDKKRERTVGIQPGKTVIWLRVRGLHLHQGGIFEKLMSASLFDAALLAYMIDLDKQKHPPAFYIPKSESAEEALWWSALFDGLEDARAWQRGTIRCMALIESHASADISSASTWAAGITWLR
jgi:malate synthase